MPSVPIPFTVTLLTDTGPGETAGVLESILRDLAPSARTVHLSHDIEPHDVRGGSLALARAIGYVASGAVVAAVDPATDRPSIAVELGDSAGVIIGPDNGLLAPAVAMAGGAERAFVLDRVAYHLASPGSELAVRDVMVPVAAYLATGVAIDKLGTEVDPAGLLPGMLPINRVEGEDIAAEVLWVDRYGSVQLNLGPGELAAALGDRVLVKFGETARTAKIATTVFGLGEAELVLVPDAYGLMCLSLCRRSVSAELGLRAGDAVTLSPVGPASSSGSTTPVTITSVQVRR